MALRQGIVSIAGLVVGSACVAMEDPADDGTESISETQQAVTLSERIAACQRDPRVVVGAVTVDICVGADLFLRETFNGNGRSCATCHRTDRNFAIDPAFMARLPANDPLFVAEFNSTLNRLEVPAQMRRFGLILENVDGFLPDPRTRFVLRSVPHTLSMGTSITRAAGDTVTPPNDRTGWSGDGAPGAGTLRDFQTGAITQHYTRNLARVVGRDFRLADSGELDRIDRFMRSVGRTNELVLTNVRMFDERAENGRLRFLAVGCNGCHANAGANAGFGGGGNRNFNTGVETARHSALAAFPRDGGFRATPANADGSFGDGTFNTPPLIEAADTGPFFHTAVTISGASAHNVQVASTIEEAIAFYDSPAFNNSPSGLVGPINLTATEIDDIGRFLRALNAVFNAAMAIKRLDATLAVINRFHNTELATQRELLRLANVEVGDALRMLIEVPNLNTGSSLALGAAGLAIEGARATNGEGERAAAILLARGSLSLVAGDIGSNVAMNIGAGTVMF